MKGLIYALGAAAGIAIGSAGTTYAADIGSVMQDMQSIESDMMQGRPLDYGKMRRLLGNAQSLQSQGYFKGNVDFGEARSILNQLEQFSKSGKVDMSKANELLRRIRTFESRSGGSSSSHSSSSSGKPLRDQAKGAWESAKSTARSWKEKIEADKYSGPEDFGVIGEYVEKGIRGGVGGALLGTLRAGTGIAHAINREPGVIALREKTYHTFTRDGRMEYQLARIGRQNDAMKLETKELEERLMGKKEEPKAPVYVAAAPVKPKQDAAAAIRAALRSATEE